MKNSIFNPAIYIMNSLTYPRKIILLGSITVLTILLLYIALYNQMSEKIIESRFQIEGIDQVMVVNKVIQLSQQYRALSSATINGDKFFFKDQYVAKGQEIETAMSQFIQSLDPKMSLDENIGDLKTLFLKEDVDHTYHTAEEDFAKHTAIIYRLQLISKLMGDHYRLITDGDLYSYYLIDNILNNIPSITENMGQLRGLIIGIVTSGKMSEQQKILLIRLESQIENSFNQFSSNTAKMLHYAPELSGEVSRAYNILNAAKVDIIDIVHNDILNREFRTDPIQFYQKVTDEIDVIYELMYQTYKPNLQQYIEHRIDHEYFLIFMIIGVTGILLTLTLYFLIGLYLAVVRNIRHVDQALAGYAKGHLDQRIYLETQDEMRTISESFNIMADRLGLLMLENENEKKNAEKANKAKSEFLSSMSHELRTPLNSILGFSQLLEEDKNPSLSDKQIEWVSYIISAGKHLLSLINDVLELSAIEAGKIELYLEPIALIDFVDDLIYLTRPLSSKVNIPIHILSDLDVAVRADNTKLKQIFINLISNGLKYNREGGTVSIDWQKMGESTVRISVIDTGIGISKSNQIKLFSAFNRLGKEATNIEGTGIGLVVTKNLVDKMGGEIGFDSVEHKGTIFWFELPLSEATQKPDLSDITDISAS